MLFLLKLLYKQLDSIVSIKFLHFYFDNSFLFVCFKFLKVEFPSWNLLNLVFISESPRNKSDFDDADFLHVSSELVELVYELAPAVLGLSFAIISFTIFIYFLFLSTLYLYFSYCYSTYPLYYFDFI